MVDGNDTDWHSTEELPHDVAMSQRINRYFVGILAGAGATATFVYGNAGPPPEARSITGKMFSQAVHWYNFGSGKIKLETTDEDLNEIILIVPNPKDESKPAE